MGAKVREKEWDNVIAGSCKTVVLATYNPTPAATCMLNGVFSKWLPGIACCGALWHQV